MPESPFETAGAQIQPTSAASLHTNEFFTGMWTQGNPLGAGAVPYLYQKFYAAARFDRIVGGQNTEISSKLTLIRRPGQSVYNAGPFPPINRFYEFRVFQNNAEQIHLLASCAPATGLTQGTVRDVTAGSNVTLWTKNAAAGRTCFVSVGNILYFADGVDAQKWVQSGKIWQANTLFNQGDFIVDPNGNIQEAIGEQIGTITAITVAYEAPLHAYARLFLSPTTPLFVPTTVTGTLAGLTTVPALNGVQTIVPGSNDMQVVVSGLTGGSWPTLTDVPETGTVDLSSGITGGSAPAWNASVGGVTVDGGAQWVNKGPAVMAWGFAAPAKAPTVRQAPAPAGYPSWQANTWYAPLFVILDSNANLQQLATAGVTGGSAPAWNVTPGGNTTDGSAIWLNLGTGIWFAGTTYTAGQIIQATFTYFVTVATGQTSVTVTCLFQCLTAGVSGASVPSWINGLGTTTSDGAVVWENMGPLKNWPGATATLSLTPRVLSSTGYIEAPQGMGESGATAPTWDSTVGALVTDNTLSWTNAGPWAPGSQYAWQWAYSGKNSVTGHIGTASPISQPLKVSEGNWPVIQGVGPTDPQEDTIVLWRTVQGGSVLMYDDEFQNPGAGVTWVYTDTNSDPSSTAAPQQGQLNFLILAPVNDANDPPPVGFLPQCYYLGRIWGWVGNRLVYSGGPDTITGSGNESFPPLNEYTFPAAGVTCWGTSIGLIAYTNSDIWVVLGQGTSSSPFYVVNFQQGVGLGSQDAFTVNGSTAYGMLTSGQVVSMDPGAGELEVGFPIGDQFNELYTPANTYLAWHQGSSADMALYAADGSEGWFRMAAVAAPESGNVWSTRALITGGVQAIASVETAPGVRRLLLGPAASAGGPILMRDLTTSEDNGTPYDAHADIGSIVMAQPGSRVQVQYITAEEIAIANSTPAYVEVLFDEISGTFNQLRNSTNDPPNLEPSETVTANRWWLSQDAGTIPICRHMQVRIGWIAENFANELLTYTIYGRLPEKARK